MRSRPRALWQAAVVAIGLASATARAAPAYDVGASVDVDAGVVDLDERVVLDAETDPTSPVELFLYADRQRRMPPSFDELTAERLFPGEASYGGYDALRVTIEGCGPLTFEPGAGDAVRGRTLRVRPCAEASKPLALRVEGRLSLAERYGTLGRAAGDLALGDPWYPLVATPGVALLPRASHVVRLRTSAPRTIVSSDGASRGDARTVRAEAETHVPFFVLDHAAVARSVVRGVDVSVVTRRAALARPVDDAAPADPFDPDAARAMAKTTADAVAFARRLGFVAGDGRDAPRTLARTLVVVEVAERQRLAATLPGVVAVSDHAFRLLPIDALARLHAMGLSRRVFAALLAPHVRAVETRADAAWVADFDASLLVDLASIADDERRRSPAELVGFAGFHPAVDQLLYAPQVAFADEYFHAVDERDPDRDGADRSRSATPFGHLVLEKLRDRVTPEAFSALTRAHLFEATSLREAASRAYGAPLDEFFETWLAGRRKLAYRLDAARSRAIDGGFEHEIDVERLGDVAVREPVVVEVRSDAGERERGVWDAAGARGVVVVRTRGALDDVVVDPDQRLPQDATLGDAHPRHDDATRHPFRPPVLNSFAFDVAALEARPSATIDFALRRKYDVRNGWGLRLASTARGLSTSVRRIFGLGPLRDANSTSASASVGLAALRSTTGYAGASEAVTQVGLALGLGRDTRRQIYDPATGSSASVGLFAGVDRPDGCAGGACTHLALVLSARAQQLFWPRVTNVVALTEGAAIARCPALAQTLPAMSGRQGLRGYELDELVGCSVAYAIVEDRYTPLRGLYVNAADLAWGKRLELVPFVSAGVLGTREAPFELRRRVFADAGLGVRAHFDYAGVQPGVLALDAAWPLSRDDACRTRSASGACAATRMPLGVWVSFEQTF